MLNHLTAQCTFLLKNSHYFAYNMTIKLDKILISAMIVLEVSFLTYNLRKGNTFHANVCNKDMSMILLHSLINEGTNKILKVVQMIFDIYLAS